PCRGLLRKQSRLEPAGIREKRLPGRRPCGWEPGIGTACETVARHISRSILRAAGTRSRGLPSALAKVLRDCESWRKQIAVDAKDTRHMKSVRFRPEVRSKEDGRPASPCERRAERARFPRQVRAHGHSGKVCSCRSEASGRR